MSSSSSHSHSSYSADESGYVTGRPRVNPPSIQEDEDPRNTDSDHEVTSERATGDGLRVSPTSVLPRPTPIIVQPNPNGPRTRQTARKSVPIPRRVTLRSARPEAPEPPRVITGVPVGRVSGMTWAEEQQVRAMAAELHGCQVRVTHQGQVVTELVELSHLLYNVSTQALESARTARRTAMRAELACVIGGVVLSMLVLLILIDAYLGWY